jgi:hypothetical protein
VQNSALAVLTARQFHYKPLRPQTTIEIDQLNNTSNETQPKVRISMIYIEV